MSIKSRLKPNPEFSSSSMADLVFLLLIFFMLTSSFVTQAGVTIDLPKSDSQKPSEGRNAVTISAEGSFFWNEEELGKNKDKEIAKEEIALKIQEVLTDDDPNNNVVTLRTDLSVTMEDAAFVISEVARNEGKIIIATEKK